MVDIKVIGHLPLITTTTLHYVELFKQLSTQSVVNNGDQMLQTTNNNINFFVMFRCPLGIWDVCLTILQQLQVYDR